MTFAARPLGLFQGPSRVTFQLVGSTIQWWPQSGYGSAVPLLNRNGSSGIYCNGAMCTRIIYDASFDRTTITVPYAAMTGGVDQGAGFLTRLISNGAEIVLTGSTAGGSSRDWTFSGNGAGISAGGTLAISFK